MSPVSTLFHSIVTVSIVLKTAVIQMQICFLTKNISAETIAYRVNKQ